MERVEVEEVIKSFITEELSCDLDDNCIDQDIVKDIGLDNLDTIELAMHLEEQYDIEITDDEIDNANTINKLIDLCIDKKTL